LTRLTLLRGWGFDLISFAAGDFVSRACQRGQLGQFCPRSTPSILSIQSTPSKPRRRQAAWRKAPPLMMITQAFRDDFGEIIDVGHAPAPEFAKNSQNTLIF